MPVVIELQPSDGSILNFMSFQWYETSESNEPWYQTYGGIYHDVEDINDKKPYYYLSFIMNDILQVIKVSKED
jgi:hypothetical protein